MLAQLSRTRRIEHEAQDRVVIVLRDHLGYPRLAQPDEGGSGWVVIVCGVLLAAVYASVWFLS